MAAISPDAGSQGPEGLDAKRAKHEKRIEIKMEEGMRSALLPILKFDDMYAEPAVQSWLGEVKDNTGLSNSVVSLLSTFETGLPVRMGMQELFAERKAAAVLKELMVSNTIVPNTVLEQAMREDNKAVSEAVMKSLTARERGMLLQASESLAGLVRDHFAAFNMPMSAEQFRSLTIAASYVLAPHLQRFISETDKVAKIFADAHAHKNFAKFDTDGFKL